MKLPSPEQVTIPLIRQIVQRPKLADTVFRFDPWGNPFGEQVFANARAMYPRLHADGPVVYRRLYQQWCVTGYEEAREILGSSEVGVARQVESLLRVRPYNRLSPRTQRFFSLFLLFVDPPDHTRLRRLVAEAFMPRRVQALEGRIEALADELLDDLGPRPELMNSFSVHLPIQVIAELLGLPREDWDWARQATSEIVKLLDPFAWFDPEEMDRTVDEVFARFTQLGDARRRHPQDDLLTALVEAEDDGERLSHEEFVTMAMFLMGAGHETTASLLGNSVVALARHPEQRRLLMRDDSLWPNAIEELARFDTSVRRDPRSALDDIEVGGHMIPAGAPIMLLLDAANNDPRRFDKPDQLNLEREDPRPLSFGYGTHHCLGAALARLELRAGLKAVLDRYGEYALDESALTWRRSMSIHGPAKLYIER